MILLNKGILRLALYFPQRRKGLITMRKIHSTHSPARADSRKASNRGFSLVELIIVIAIMAVLTAVLAPQLLRYVERSRVAKDEQAIDEVYRAVQLTLANEAVYTEIANYCAKNGNHLTIHIRNSVETSTRGMVVHPDMAFGRNPNLTAFTTEMLGAFEGATIEPSNGAVVLPRKYRLSSRKYAESITATEYALIVEVTLTNGELVTRRVEPT